MLLVFDSAKQNQKSYLSFLKKIALKRLLERILAAVIFFSVFSILTYFILNFIYYRTIPFTPSDIHISANPILPSMTTSDPKALGYIMVQNFIVPFIFGSISSLIVWHNLSEKIVRVDINSSKIK
jgi:hypothetical protein